MYIYIYIYIRLLEYDKLQHCVFLQSQKLLHKYVAMYSASLIKEGKSSDALALYVQHGAPALPQVGFRLARFCIVPYCMFNDGNIDIIMNI